MQDFGGADELVALGLVYGSVRSHPQRVLLRLLQHNTVEPETTAEARLLCHSFSRLQLVVASYFTVALSWSQRAIIFYVATLLEQSCDDLRRFPLDTYIWCLPSEDVLTFYSIIATTEAKRPAHYILRTQPCACAEIDHASR